MRQKGYLEVCRDSRFLLWNNGTATRMILKGFLPAGRRSILVRLGVAMAVIIGLAVASIVVSVVMTEASSGKAKAINVAGSLRMLSFRMALEAADRVQGSSARERAVGMVMEEFERRLKSPVLSEPSRLDSDGVVAAYRGVQVIWHDEVLPGLLDVARGNTSRAAFDEKLAAFVVSLDHYVQLLEHELEVRIQMQRLIQGVTLFLVIMTVLFTLFFAQVHLVDPLGSLLDAARGVRAGNFSVRAEADEGDEMGQVAEAFNYMVEDLSRMYSGLEQRVEEKTRELARTNQSLELLYGTIRKLSEQTLNSDTLASVLHDVEKVAGVRAGAICACEPGRNQGYRLAGSLAPEDAGAEACRRASCGDCFSSEQSAGSENIVSVPLVDGGKVFGVMPLLLPTAKALQPWQRELTQAVGRHIGAALAGAQRKEEHHRLALFEERSIIARELHDSLAQSLSYLKIQVTRLQQQLSRGAPAEDIDGVVSELKEGLANAYRQLRELLTTFRLRVDGRGLFSALESTVEEFSTRAGLRIALDNHLLGLELASNEEIHVLQVVREALSNVEHHAKAQNVVISLQRESGNHIRVRVDDDGVGIASTESPVHHYGLTIMKDRAASLGGEVVVTRREDGGTRVELSFCAVSPFGDGVPGQMRDEEKGST